MRMRILANNYPIFFLHLIFSLSLTNTNSETLAILVPAAQHRHRSRLGSGLFFILNNSFNIRHTLQLQLHSHFAFTLLRFEVCVYCLCYITWKNIRHGNKIFYYTQSQFQHSSHVYNFDFDHLKQNLNTSTSTSV
jgi:hypothetical protein